MSDHHPILAAFLKAGGGPLAMREPLGESLRGVILEMDPMAGAAVLSFEPDDRFLQGGGAIQGGIVTAMLDYAMALAAFSRLPASKSFGTVSITTHFLKPARTGLHVARATLDRMGGSMIFASGTLSRDGVDAPLATGTAVMAITAR